MHDLIRLCMVIISCLGVLSFKLFPAKSSIQKHLKVTKSLSRKMSTETCTTASAPVEYFRKNYSPAPYVTTDIYLSFKIAPELTKVTAASQMSINKEAKFELSNFPNLEWEREELSLQSIKVNGKIIPIDYYTVTNVTGNYSESGNYLQSI